VGEGTRVRVGVGVGEARKEGIELQPVISVAATSRTSNLFISFSKSRFSASVILQYFDSISTDYPGRGGQFQVDGYIWIPD
jgi:hypothetical protein